MDASLLEIVSKDPTNIEKLVKGIERAVQRSFDSDMIRDANGRVMTSGSEVKRRVNLCIDMAKQLRGDASWSIPRIVDTLPKMLRRRLDGQDWDPTTETARTTWRAEE
jgi:hypothetical protein